MRFDEVVKPRPRRQRAGEHQPCRAPTPQQQRQAREPERRDHEHGGPLPRKPEVHEALRSQRPEPSRVRRDPVESRMQPELVVGHLAHLRHESVLRYAVHRMCAVMATARHVGVERGLRAGIVRRPERDSQVVPQRHELVELGVVADGPRQQHRDKHCGRDEREPAVEQQEDREQHSSHRIEQKQQPRQCAEQQRPPAANQQAQHQQIGRIHRVPGRTKLVHRKEDHRDRRVEPRPRAAQQPLRHQRQQRGIKPVRHQRPHQQCADEPAAEQPHDPRHDQRPQRRHMRRRPGQSGPKEGIGERAVLRETQRQSVSLAARRDLRMQHPVNERRDRARREQLQISEPEPLPH